MLFNVPCIRLVLKRELDMTKVEKIAQLIKTKFGKNVDTTTFYRTYAGYWQRSKGAYSWTMSYEDAGGVIASCYSITDLIKNWDKAQMINNEEISL